MYMIIYKNGFLLEKKIDVLKMWYVELICKIYVCFFWFFFGILKIIFFCNLILYYDLVVMFLLNYKIMFF